MSFYKKTKNQLCNTAEATRSSERKMKMKLCGDCQSKDYKITTLQARIVELEAEIQQRPLCPDCRDQCLEKATKHLRTQLATLRTLKCPPISDGDTCICPIEEAEGEVERLKTIVENLATGIEIRAGIKAEQAKEIKP